MYLKVSFMVQLWHFEKFNLDVCCTSPMAMNSQYDNTFEHL